jgi:hypothetical protein
LSFLTEQTRTGYGVGFGWFRRFAGFSSSASAFRTCFGALKNIYFCLCPHCTGTLFGDLPGRAQLQFASLEQRCSVSQYSRFAAISM